MLVRLSRAPVLSGGLRRKTQLFSCTLYMAASSKTPPHQSKDPQKFKTPLQVPVFPGSSPLCHHTKSQVYKDILKNQATFKISDEKSEVFETAVFGYKNEITFLCETIGVKPKATDSSFLIA
ncbi:hypothetical protein TNCV_688431 [Trichonephila clavipes]|nr:hypothetical protein TNCV_688431 [Trichonephila clavipes]